MQAVLVVIEPRGARAEVRVGDARRLRHVAELEVPFVAEQPIAFERRDVDVVPAVVVVVADGDAHAVHLDVEAAAGGHVRERAVLVVAIERVQRAPGPGLPVLRVDQEDVGPAVVVRVEERDARAERLGQVLLARRGRCCGRT